MSAPTDNRLADAPMVWVACRRREADLLSAHGGRGVFLACSDLAESIRNAARDGELPVLDDQLLATDRPARRP